MGPNTREHYPSSFPEVVRRQCNSIKRRSSKFFSLLADAENNRIELHSEPRPEPEQLSSIIPKSSLYRSLRRSPAVFRAIRNNRQGTGRLSPPPGAFEELTPFRRFVGFVCLCYVISTEVLMRICGCESLCVLVVDNI